MDTDRVAMMSYSSAYPQRPPQRQVENVQYKCSLNGQRGVGVVAQEVTN